MASAPMAGPDAHTVDVALLGAEHLIVDELVRLEHAVVVLVQHVEDLVHVGHEVGLGDHAFAALVHHVHHRLGPEGRLEVRGPDGGRAGVHRQEVVPGQHALVLLVHHVEHVAHVLVVVHFGTHSFVDHLISFHYL